jgi:isopenicillin-N epimerase
MVASISTIKISSKKDNGVDFHELDPLHLELLKNYNIQVPVWYWPSPEGRYIRISAQLYNNKEEYEYLANVLKKCL